LLADGDLVGTPTDTWTPDAGVDLRDGRALHELLYEGGDLSRPRAWCAPATQRIVAAAVDTIDARIATVGAGDTIRVLDYGTGTGMAAIELLKACREIDAERRLGDRGAALQLHLVDLPSSWFAQGHRLLRASACVTCHALKGPDGRFRPLPEVLGGRAMDLIVSSMVFHLIPPRALARAVGGLADVLAPGGRLLWNAPDVGPAQPGTVLLHDPNRALRARWKELLRDEREPRGPRQAQIVARARAVAAECGGDERADRRILPRPTEAPALGDAIGARLTGAITTASHEMTVRECLDTLFVPSNQEEYLPEIDDASARAALIEDLLLADVLPLLRAGPAGTAAGYRVHWTFGDHRA
jgi:SAM-dependent methyltransferase